MPGIATSLIAGAFGVASGTFAFSLIQLGVGLAFSAASQALARRRQKDKQAPGLRTKFTGRGDSSPQTIILGRYATAGHEIAPFYAHTNPTPVFAPVGAGDFATFIINIADAPIEDLLAVYVDGTRFDMATQMTGPVINDDYGVTVGQGVGRDQWYGRLWVKFYDGTQTEADPYLLKAYGSHPTRPWKTTSVHRGSAYAIVTLRRDTTLFRGRPQFLFDVQGMRLRDPRDNVVRYSDNANVLAYNVMNGITLPDGRVFGVGAEQSELPLDYWRDAINDCDAQVSNSSGGTERQYRAGLEIPMATPDDGGSDALTAVDDLFGASFTSVADIGGEWVVRTGSPGLPVMSISDDDILNSSDQSYDPFIGLAEAVNSVTATYPDSDRKWESTETPLWADNDAITRDGRPLLAALQLDAVPFGDQAVRLSASAGRDAQRRRSHVIMLPARLDRVVVLDTISLSSPRHGYVNKMFEIQQYTPDLRTGDFQLLIREVDPNDFVPRPADYVAGPVVDVSRQTLAPLVITDFTPEPFSIQGANGAERAGIKLTWSVPANEVAGIAWEVRRVGQVAIETEGSSIRSQLSLVVVSDGILPGTGYEIRILPILEGRGTGWSAWKAVTTPSVLLGTADIGLAAVLRDNVEFGLLDNVETVVQAPANAFNNGNIMFERNLGSGLGEVNWNFNLQLQVRDFGTYNWNFNGETGVSPIRTVITLRTYRDGVSLPIALANAIPLEISEPSDVNFDLRTLQRAWQESADNVRVRAVMSLDYGYPGAAYVTSQTQQTNVRQLRFEARASIK